MWDPASGTISHIDNWKVLTVTNCPTTHPGIQVTTKEFHHCMTLTNTGISYETFQLCHYQDCVKPLLPKLPNPREIDEIQESDPSKRTGTST